MNALVLGIPHFDFVAVTTIFVGIGAAEYLVQDDHRMEGARNDFWLDFVATLQFFAFKPLTVFATGTLLWQLFPVGKDSLADMSPIWMFLAIVLCDDLVQYWYHRAAHKYTFLWKLHRAHHSAPEMGIRVTYRNAMLFYILMPNIWLGAILIYLGMGGVYLCYSILKLTVVMAAHSELRWDQPLYRSRFLRPIAWLVERSISTPATHFAHHGLCEEDGASAPNGNFSNMFFIWDLMFGTARITRKFPTRFGVKTDRRESWWVQLYYPLQRSEDPCSELH